jgi:hypothetical protein
LIDHQGQQDTKEHKESILSKSVDDVALPMPIVARRKVRAEVGAAAFFPAKRRARDQTRDGRQTTETPPVGRIRLNDGRRRLERYDCFRETSSIAEQTRAPPHQITNRDGRQGLGARG